MKLLHLDERRRVSLARFGRKEHTRYIANVMDDGVIILTPATVVPIGAKPGDCVPVRDGEHCECWQNDEARCCFCNSEQDEVHCER